MTRDEAIKIAGGKASIIPWPDRFVDSLVELGLLKLDPPNDDIALAIDRLTGCFVHVRHGFDGDSLRAVYRLDREGAGEILDVLLKSGFKVTR